jgi:type IV pilus assembly protein PilO
MATPRSVNAKRVPRINLALMLEDAKAQFQGLNPREPGQWPLLPKLVSWGAVLVLAVVAGWFVVLADAVGRLQAEQDREPMLKGDFRLKLNQAINLGELRKQKLQVQEYVNQVEKQLPGKAEMDALLSDINQAGLGRGLLFESFKPGQVQVRDYYAELPIALKVTGKYHDVGAFAADIANLSRIVTLHDLSLTVQAGQREAGRNPGTATLTLEASARTYRYLDPNESADQEARRKAAAKGAKK